MRSKIGKLRLCLLALCSLMVTPAESATNPLADPNGTGSTIQITDSGAAALPKRFYRVVVR